MRRKKSYVEVSDVVDSGFKSFSPFLELNVCPSGQFSKPRFSQIVL